jgi:hypothetical protein
VKALFFKYEILFHGAVFLGMMALYLHYPAYEVPQGVYWGRIALSVIYGIVGIIYISRSFDEKRAHLRLRGYLLMIAGCLMMCLDLINNAIEVDG